MPAGITIGIKGSTIEVAPKEGKRTPLRLETVTPDERRRLVLCDASGMAVEPAALWLSEVGLPVAPNSWEVVFARASRRCQNAGLAFDVSPHQLRHSFAVRTLLAWYRAGLEVEPQLPLLSTHLGHIKPASTYWYLQAAPELLAIAGQRLENVLGELP